MSMDNPNYMEELEALERSIPERYAKVRDSQGYHRANSELFGEDGPFVGIMMSLMELPQSGRASFGAAINRVAEAAATAQEECLKRLKAS